MAHASKENEEGRLRERDILRKVSSVAPTHRGFSHVVHSFHEFTFESFAGHHICFVTDVLSYDIFKLPYNLFPGRLFPPGFVLLLAKHVLKGLEYLHNECNIVHSGMSYTISTADINDGANRVSRFKT